MKGFQELRKGVFWARIIMMSALIYLAVYVLFSAIHFVWGVMKLTLAGIPPTSLRELPAFFLDWGGRSGILAVILLIVGGVCELLNKKFTKEFQDCVLKGTDLESEERRFERDKVEREVEERKEDYGNVISNYLATIYSFRDYSLFTDGELKFLSEKLGAGGREPQHTRGEAMADAISMAEEDDSIFEQAKVAAENHYQKLLREGYSQEEAKRRSERFRLAILDNFRGDDS